MLLKEPRVVPPGCICIWRWRCMHQNPPADESASVFISARHLEVMVPRKMSDRACAFSGSWLLCNLLLLAGSSIGKWGKRAQPFAGRFLFGPTGCCLVPCTCHSPASSRSSFPFLLSWFPPHPILRFDGSSGTHAWAVCAVGGFRPMAGVGKAEPIPELNNGSLAHVPRAAAEQSAGGFPLTRPLSATAHAAEFRLAPA
jgi:hypothetical protein